MFEIVSGQTFGRVSSMDSNYLSKAMTISSQIEVSSSSSIYMNNLLSVYKYMNSSSSLSLLFPTLPTLQQLFFSSLKLTCFFPTFLDQLAIEGTVPAFFIVFQMVACITQASFLLQLWNSQWCEYRYLFSTLCATESCFLYLRKTSWKNLRPTRQQISSFRKDKNWLPISECEAAASQRLSCNTSLDITYAIITTAITNLRSVLPSQRIHDDVSESIAGLQMRGFRGRPMSDSLSDRYCG